MYPQGPTHQKMGELLGKSGVDTVDGVKPLTPTPFEPKPAPVKSVASLEKAKVSLFRDAQEGKPGTAARIRQHQLDTRNAERNMGKTGFKTVRINTVTDLPEKVSPPKKRKPILPQPMKQTSLLDNSPPKFDMGTPTMKKMISAFADMKAGKPVPMANLDNLPDRTGTAKKPDVMTMEIKPGDETGIERPKPYDMTQDPIEQVQNMSAETGSDGGGSSQGAAKKPATPAPSTGAKTDDLHPDQTGGREQTPKRSYPPLPKYGPDHKPTTRITQPDWEEWQGQMDKDNLSPTQRRALGDIFSNEGGNRKHEGATAVVGIPQKTINDFANARDPKVREKMRKAGIKAGIKPEELTSKQR